MTKYQKFRFNLSRKQEKDLKDKVIAYFKEVSNIKRITDIIESKGVEHFKNNLEEYFMFDKYAEIIYQHWGQTGAKFAEITEENIKSQYYINQKRREPVKISTGFFSQTYVDNMVRYAKATAGELITKVNDTTIKLVKESLAKAGEQRLGAKETAKLINKSYGFGKARALTIARTETTAAAESGSFIVAKSWNVEMTTTWGCAFKNSRDSHISADGQTVKLGEYFTVGGAKMKHPGDRNGGASEVINCNCTTYNKVIQPPEPDSIQPAYKPREREFSFAQLVTSLIALFVSGDN
jgi:hypothetical protein